jgi:hypothetical protein
MARPLRLPPEIEQLVNFVVERNVEAISAPLRKLQIEAPAYAACLWPSQEDELNAYPVSVGLEPDRQRARRSLTPSEAFRTVWNPNTYAIDGVDPEPDLRADPDFIAAEAQVGAALDEREILDPPRWILNRVARRLTESPALSPVTDDFVAFVLDHDFDDDLLESLRESATPAVAQALRAKQLLPRNVMALEGFIDPLD